MKKRGSEQDTMGRVSDVSHNNLLKKFEKQKEALKEAKETIKERDGSIAELQGDLEEFEATKSDLLKLQQDNKTLVTQNDVLHQKLEAALKALKDSGKHAKWEESTAVRKEINKWIKDCGYRETKFAKDGALDDFTKAVYDGIKERLGLEDETSHFYQSSEEFVRVYTAHVNAQLSVRRQYTQSMCLKAVVRTYQQMVCDILILGNLHLLFPSFLYRMVQETWRSSYC